MSIDVRQSAIEAAVREHYGDAALEYYRAHPGSDIDVIIKSLEQAGFTRRESARAN